MINRAWVTPFTAGAFLLSAVTGVLIFFHIDSGANKFVHEWLSWALLTGVALHTFTNWNAFKKHLSVPSSQLIVGIFVVALAVSFISFGKGGGKPPFMRSIKALADAPLVTLAAVAQISPEELMTRMTRAGFQPLPTHKSLSDIVGNDVGKQMRVLNGMLGEGK
ncbi:MAG: hypothetical protein RL368_986 [Pseudomonadota bacterium]